MLNPDPSISAQLRAAIEASGVSRYWIWRETGIAESTLSKFMAGKGGLSIEGIDAIGRVLRLRLGVDGEPAAATEVKATKRRKPNRE